MCVCVYVRLKHINMVWLPDYCITAADIYQTQYWSRIGESRHAVCSGLFLYLLVSFKYWLPKYIALHIGLCAQENINLYLCYHIKTISFHSGYITVHNRKWGVGRKMVCLLNSIHGKIGIFIFEQKVQERGAEVEDRSPRWTTSYCIIIITIMIIITVYELGNDVRLGNGPCTNKSNRTNAAGAPVLTVIRVKIAKCSRDFHRFITAQPRYLPLHLYTHSMVL